MTVEDIPREGWAMPGNANRSHYFRAGKALCRRWMFIGEVNEDFGFLRDDPGPADCLRCWRARKRELRP